EGTVASLWREGPHSGLDFGARNPWLDTEKGVPVRPRAGTGVELPAAGFGFAAGGFLFGVAFVSGVVTPWFGFRAAFVGLGKREARAARLPLGFGPASGRRVRTGSGVRAGTSTGEAADATKAPPGLGCFAQAVERRALVRIEQDIASAVEFRHAGRRIGGVADIRVEFASTPAVGRLDGVGIRIGLHLEYGVPVGRIHGAIVGPEGRYSQASTA